MQRVTKGKYIYILGDPNLPPQHNLPATFQVRLWFLGWTACLYYSEQLTPDLEAPPMAP